eukprot:m.190591 g.190591  ORF g.190591 m.190591 type:complete len:71 (+) comp14823_c0_seq1:811-1023(+)
MYSQTHTHTQERVMFRERYSTSTLAIVLFLSTKSLGSHTAVVLESGEYETISQAILCGRHYVVVHPLVLR